MSKRNLMQTLAQSYWTSLGAVALVAATGCSDDDPVGGLPDNVSAVVAGYTNDAHANYEAASAAAVALDGAVTALVGDPTAANIDAARQAWLEAREPYLVTEVYRFYDGPIDNPEDGPEGLINGWPLNEANIDYVDGDDMAGIVNDGSATIDADALVSLNEEGGEENITAGFHAVEFLLWGQDLSETGPGARPHTDFDDSGMGTAANQMRRGLYLSTSSALLVTHLDDITAAWDPSATYRLEMEAAAPEEGLRRILTGMIILTGFETGGERLQTAYDSGDQGDEHSCFSDNSHRDFIQDIQGVQDVYRGNGTAPGVRDVVAAIDADLATRLDEKIAEALGLANDLVPPFDSEILLSNTDGRARVLALITALREQEELLQDVFQLLELSAPAGN